VYRFDVTVSSTVKVDGTAPVPARQEPLPGPLPDELLARTQRWGFDRDRLVKIAELAKSRVERLSDLVPAAAYLFAGRIAVTKEAVIAIAGVLARFQSRDGILPGCAGSGGRGGGLE